MRALAVLILAPAFALGVAAGAVGLVGHSVEHPQKAESVLWSDRVFVSRSDLAHWLRARGATYDAWAQRHPSAASIFGDSAARPTASVSSRLASDKRKRHHDALVVGLIAGISLTFLLVIYASRERIRIAVASQRKRARASRPRLRHGAWNWTAQLAAIRGRLPRVHVHAPHMRVPTLSVSRAFRLQRPNFSPHPRLAPNALEALRRHPWLSFDVHAALHRPRVRRLLSRVVFYGLAFVCSLAIGASVAIYLQ